jgi:hypothetical protein
MIQERRYTSSRSIRTPQVLEAQHALLAAIEQRVKVSDLRREQAEAQLSGLLGDIWTEAERVFSSLPGHAFVDRDLPGKPADSD